ncbi:MAG: tRNA guanosine(34) transglycosylase Tgt [Planctomycetales bacterium]
MSATDFHFELLHADPTTAARRGVFHTPRGPVRTPAFMPVGTLATVKGLTIDQVKATGAEMILSNTYHLAIRPGEDVIQAQGGIRRFMGWEGPVLTDSGGFQIFSLADQTKITEQGAQFRSHVDGRLIDLSPERAVEIQEALGSDVAMVLDHVIALPASRDAVQDAMERSVRWARRCRDVAERADQALFAIVQGGLEPDLRVACAEQLRDLDFPGYAVGGLSVGEAPEEMYRVLDVVCPVLPADRPRYLMGVGRPADLLEGIARGIDLFDCVMPTRNGRNALAFTDQGPTRLRNLKHRDDSRPLESDCPCAACRHSRSYLRHLFMAGEMLGPILTSIHNLTYYQRLLEQARAAIEAGDFDSFRASKHAGWNANRPAQDG